MGDYRSSSHVYWRCKYHIVWTPKYRFKILKGNLGKELYRSIYILCNMKGCEVLELNVQIDHVHLVVIIPPKLSVSTLMGVLKGRSAIRRLRRDSRRAHDAVRCRRAAPSASERGIFQADQSFRGPPDPCQRRSSLLYNEADTTRQV